MQAAFYYYDDERKLLWRQSRGDSNVTRKERVGQLLHHNKHANGQNLVFPAAH
jgi:hypothetical protein